MNPLVSILVPAYNAERWIGLTLRSAIGQTWPRTEVIVVDDGSKDATLAAVRCFQSGHVKVVTQDNAGACVARNHALSLAQGDYIQWLDADDLLHREKVARQVAALGEMDDGLTLLTSAYGQFHADARKARFLPDALWQDLGPVEWMMAKFSHGAWMNPATWLVSRRLAACAGPWDPRLARSGDDDGEYVCRLVRASARVRFVPAARAYYRIGNATSLSSQRTKEAMLGRFLATKLAIDHLLALEDSPRTRHACVQHLQHRLRYFYPEQAEVVDEARALAARLGGHLAPPRERPAFRAVRRLVGWPAAKHARARCWQARLHARRMLERLPLRASSLE
jgi:glycosyltransferase involved in cell wall biosynthesis